MYEASAKENVKCPECGSEKLYRDGLGYRGDGSTVQRWLCRNCGLRFRENPKRKGGRQILNLNSDIFSKRQVCVSLARGAKNLASTAQNGNPAVETTQREIDVKEKIFEFAWWMQKQGYAAETIRLNTGALRTLTAKGANLFNPETVKEVLAKEQGWGPNRRRNIINAYTLFLKYNGLKWEKPKCQVTRKIPFIPLESEIDELIAGCPQTVATFLQLLKETAMRAGEAKRLKWTDIDFQRRIIILNTPEKGSLPRIFNNLSGKLLGMLNALPRKSQYVFGDCTLNSLKAIFYRARRRLAFKLQNPRLLNITFHTLRHWRATMEYHYTKDILHVKEFLGHKEIDNTLIYIQLDKNLFNNLPNDQFIIKAVHNVEEAVKLGEIGFEPFDVVNGVRLYRKRK
ncbi:MAG: tyrosine-type recombinase/integrase [Candidatus Bathyarchaeia archaeon]